MSGSFFRIEIGVSNFLQVKDRQYKEEGKFFGEPREAWSGYRIILQIVLVRYVSAITDFIKSLILNTEI